MIFIIPITVLAIGIPNIFSNWLSRSMVLTPNVSFSSSANSAALSIASASVPY